MDLETAKREWTEHVLSLAADRFERRLAEELSGLRVDIAKGQSDLRTELHEGLAGVRKELYEGLAGVRSDVRKELHEGLAGVRSDVRKELHEGLAGVRVEMANMRVEWLRWSFLFWIGQIGVVAGMLAYLLRALQQ